MKENNIINLADHITKRTPIQTFQIDDLNAFAIEKERIGLRRAFAFICDLFLVITFTNMAVSSYAFFVKEFLQPMSMGQKTQMMSSVWALGLGVSAVVAFTYFFYCAYFLEGKTAGSWLMKLTIIDESWPFTPEKEEYVPSAAQCAKRTLGYLACYLSFGAFFFFTYLNDEKRGVPDFVSGTRMVSDEWLKSFVSHKELHKEHIRININSLERVA